MKARNASAVSSLAAIGQAGEPALHLVPHRLEVTHASSLANATAIRTV